MQLFRYLVLFIFLTGMVSQAAAYQVIPNPSTDKSPSSEYLELIEWLTKQSNDYSGILNDRQTWIVSHDGYQIKEEYYWDNQLTVVIEFDIRNIEKANSELRFYHSIVLYPKDGDPGHFQVTRYDDGLPSKVEAEYYNLMIDPTIKKEVYKKMLKAIEVVNSDLE